MGPGVFFDFSKLSTWGSLNDISKAFLDSEGRSLSGRIVPVDQQLLDSIEVSASLIHVPILLKDDVASKK